MRLICKFWAVGVIAVLVAGLLISPALAKKSKKELIEEWRPKFDYSKAKYKLKVSNITTPTDISSGIGFEIRDELWKRTNGQIYFEYLPFGILGGEVEVFSQLRSGAIQGMASNSQTAVNLGPRMELCSLPFLLDSYEKIEKFIANKKLFQTFMDSMKHQGIIGVDVTIYGMYGWATSEPVTNLNDLGSLKIRIAESRVGALIYKNWGINPIVMPWPEVHVALKQGVINALDHTINVCNTQKIFEITKNYTKVNYAPGLFVWVFNEAWFNTLPKKLQQIFLEVVHEKCAKARKEWNDSRPASQEYAVKNFGVKFNQLDAKTLATLKERSKKTYQECEERIGREYLDEVVKFIN